MVYCHCPICLCDLSGDIPLPRVQYLMVGVSDFHGDTEMRGVAERPGIPGLQQEVT